MLVQRALVVGVLLLLVTSCGHNPDKVPVDERSAGSLNSSGLYVVQRGDSLYSIAWNYGLEYQALARANGLQRPYTIQPGQRLRIQAPGKSSSQPSGKRARPTQRTSRSASGVPASNTESWAWPGKGRLSRFYSNSGNLHKGIDIQGKIGQPVYAAKSGKVVYAGTGLKAYGLLVIVKHDTRYLSAYAYNKSALVKEGDSVKKGQQIARMGTREGNQAIIHFEIRRDGKTVDPMTLLPRR